ncbi:hypothetical protein CC1G_11066 [Coprinopsis cinerea okayama7|uniref:SANT domain-containing protein n=1 Tax=Coprinopsis cinerea (strain Okayama-7 / 130 / ATCC MYA-4618 / FGSC 9003) TaxID=240176 RepID=A8NC97_COPC7|nr:hypothetical protein CC1G_11066 [Coprinopsis cinerea okayama7\|eukprot:XP_001832441.2 hypothetical protein CC1G_11066 [Coprinopsis cinerea okayama7\
MSRLNVGKNSVPPPPDVPNGSTRVEESIRSVPAVLPSSTASSRPSSTASTPPPPQFNGPQALLANRFKAAQISSPAPSSPLSSSVVPGENAPEIAKSPLAEEPKTEKRTESPEVSSGIQPSANNSLNGHAPSSGARVEPAPATQTDEAPSKPPAPADDTAGAKDDDKLMEPAKSPPPPSSTREPDQTPATELPPPREPSPPPPPVTQIKSTSFTFQSRSDVRPPQPTPVFEANDEPRLERQVLLELQPIFPRDALPTEQKPSLTNPKSKEEALRAVVMTRLLCDHQTRDELVNPVLMANRALVDSTPDPRPTAESTPDKLIAEVHRKLDESIDFATIRPSLAEHFEQRQNLVNDKVSRLSAEYLALHRKWKAHCSALNALQRSQGPESDHLLHGRTTRRTSAFTDTVRSDLEMEQVIASLGVDDLTDPNYLSSRNAATIPDMISVTEGKVDFLFDDSNHLVENPAEYYAPHTGIDDWTEEEKRIFLDRYAMYPKQFGLIAEGLPHKTAAQCVDYYYLHKKRMIDFRKVVSQLTKGRRKRGGAKKKSGALLADIAQHDAEVGKSDHLSNFIVPSRVAKPGRRRGRASAVAKTPHSGTPAGTTPQPEAVPPAAATAELRPPSDVRQSRSEETPVATPTPEPESRAKRTTRKPASTQPSTPAPPPPPPVSAPPAPAPAPSISTPVPVPATQPRSETVSAPPEPEQPKPRNRKRGRKQVKSAAIIEDDTTPPPEAPKPLPSDEPTSISVALRASTSKGSSRITPASEQESEMSQSDWP